MTTTARSFPPFSLTRLLSTVFQPKGGERVAIMIDLDNPADVKDFAFLKNPELTIQRHAYEVFYQGLKNGGLKELNMTRGDLFAYQITGGSNLDLPDRAVTPEGREELCRIGQPDCRGDCLGGHGGYRVCGIVLPAGLRIAEQDISAELPDAGNTEVAQANRIETHRTYLKDGRCGRNQVQGTDSDGARRGGFRNRQRAEFHVRPRIQKTLKTVELGVGIGARTDERGVNVNSIAVPGTKGVATHSDASVSRTGEHKPAWSGWDFDRGCRRRG